MRPTAAITIGGSTLLVLMLSGCSRGPASWSYSFEGQTNNIVGCPELEQSGFRRFEEQHAFEGYPSVLQNDERRLAIVFDGAAVGALLISFEHPDGAWAGSTRDATLRAWIVRPRDEVFRAATTRLVAERDYLNVAAVSHLLSDSDAERDNPQVIPLEGEARAAVKKGNDFERICVNLHSSGPMPRHAGWLRLWMPYMNPQQRKTAEQIPNQPPSAPFLIDGCLIGYWHYPLPV